jgi:hypothetical protein
MTGGLALALSTEAAHACGGLFCDNLEPVLQEGERILFREDGDGGWTTFVEVRFAGPPVDFAWVVPVAPGFELERDAAVAPAGVFDELERVTAPVFEDAFSYRSNGCGSPCSMGASSGYDSAAFVEFVESNVEVVGAAVVGPYEMTVVESDEPAAVVGWLQLNGYQFPTSAAPLVDHYVAQGSRFLALRLLPTTSGPIDTLELRCGFTAPTIPLVLTSVAAVPQMPITAYVLADERHVPGNYVDLAFDWGQVGWVDPGTGETDYVPRLRDAVVAAGGHAWNTEYAAPAAEMFGEVDPEIAVALRTGAYLTRFKTVLGPEDMTLDPVFVPDPEAPDVSRNHLLGRVVHSSFPVVPTPWVGALVLGWVAVTLRRRAEATQ